MCSGTLISLRLVLTAGHCIDNTDYMDAYSKFCPAPNFNDELDPDPFPCIGVKEAFVTPDYLDAASSGVSATTLNEDFALLVLETPAPPGTAFMAIEPGFGEHYFYLTTAGYPGIVSQTYCPRLRPKGLGWVVLVVQTFLHSMLCVVSEHVQEHIAFLTSMTCQSREG